MDNLPNGSSNSSFDPSRLDPNPVHHVPHPPFSPPPPPPPPAAVSVTHNHKYSEKQDPPLVDLKVTNPVTYLKNWLGKLLKNQDIDIRIKIKPFATIAFLLAFSAVFGVGYNLGLSSAAKVFFPNSSPLLHRAITVEGVVQKSSSGKYYLASGNNQWELRSSQASLNPVAGKEITVKGNLTAEKNVINVSEVIPVSLGEESSPSVSPVPASSPLNSPNTLTLPNLYPTLQWEKDEKKVLLFTSGKRRIEQEGVYLESILVKDYPQEFINYYVGEFSNLGFKQTLNSAEPSGVTITYAKDNTFFTFGVKNIYTGSGDKKALSGYRAYIEHN